MSNMLRCLVVDDDESCRFVARSLAEGCGLSVQTAEDGIDALEKCKENIPDVILLDWMMPRMDGLEFLKEYKRMEGSDKTHIIMCSAKDESSEIRKALDNGANTYLCKPFSPEDLEVKLGLIIKLKRDSIFKF